MKPFIVLSLFIYAAVVSCARDLAPFNYDPIANPSCVFTQGKVRITVLTDRIVRMEQAKGTTFEDRATLAVVNRKVSGATCQSSVDNNILTITTKYLTVKYPIGQGAESITIQSLNGAFTEWFYGKKDSGNLLGTIKSLDLLDVISLNCTQIENVTIHQESLHCTWGLISTLGWTSFEDSDTPIMDETDYPGFPTSVDEIDHYFLGFGMEYKDALKEYSWLGGKIAMTPRYTIGIWWSIWYDVNIRDVNNIISEYTGRQMPLDVYILDMDWHSKYAWGGYSWDHNLFPSPSYALSTIRKNYNLYYGANIHDANGVGIYETQHDNMCKALAIPLNECTVIPFDIANSTYGRALDDVVLKAVEDDGMNFWWIDWQQGGKQGGCLGGKHNPTILLNHLRATDPYRRGLNERGHLLARWGGRGSHRYQVGFSGDVNTLSWQNLAFQPYFTLTSSNVLYGFWSHDLVGPPNDLELYTRWIQWGSVSPIFRTHDRGLAGGICANTDSCAIVKMWTVPSKYFNVMRDAVQFRSRLGPYLYTLSRIAFDDGLSPMRPMYYDYANQSRAYSVDEGCTICQYMLGDDLLISPVVVPADPSVGMATTSVWVPPGFWTEINTGVVYYGGTPDKGGLTVSLTWDLTELPVFVKGGSVIPMLPASIFLQYPTTGIAVQAQKALQFSIYPATDAINSNPAMVSGSTNIYEDDGFTLDYLQDKYANVYFSYSQDRTSAGRPISVTIDMQGTAYNNMPMSRTFIISLVNSPPIDNVTSSYPGAEHSTWYDGDAITAYYQINDVPFNIGATLKLNIVLQATQLKESSFSGVRGILNHATLSKRNLDETRQNAGAHNPIGGQLSLLSSFGAVLTQAAIDANTTLFMNTILSVPQQFLSAWEEVHARLNFTGNELITLFDFTRFDNVLCGSHGCIRDNYVPEGYSPVAVEGYQPYPEEEGAVPLYDYYSVQNMDNWATTSPTAPPGYSNAAFSNGYVLTTPKPNTKPLQLWLKSSKVDHFVTSRVAGVTWAKNNGYELVNASFAYVYCTPQTEVGNAIFQSKRFLYSVELLRSVYPKSLVDQCS